MKIKYLNYQQAQAICRDYQHLLSQPFGTTEEDAAHTVNTVVVAPYSRILQWSFARLVVKGTPPPEALKQWSIDRFDVVVISQNRYNPSDFQIKDLRTYLGERGIEFSTVHTRGAAA